MTNSLSSLYAWSAREMPRAKLIIMPSPSSATACPKPRVARVTRMPRAEAALTSIVLMSTAHRRKASRFGILAKAASVPATERCAMTT